MAYLIIRKGSKSWWLRHKDPDGKWKSASTGPLYDSEEQTAQAKVLCAQFGFNEARAAGRKIHDSRARVDFFIANHYRNARPLKNYRNPWRQLQRFSRSRESTRPLR